MINTKTPKTLKNKFKFIICFVCFDELIVAKYPVKVVPIFAPNIIAIEQDKDIILLEYICSTMLIIPEEDWIMAVDKMPNKVDKVTES